MMMDGGECVAHCDTRPSGLVRERGGVPGVWPTVLRLAIHRLCKLLEIRLEVALHFP